MKAWSIRLRTFTDKTVRYARRVAQSNFRKDGMNFKGYCGNKRMRSKLKARSLVYLSTLMHRNTKNRKHNILCNKCEVVIGVDPASGDSKSAEMAVADK